MARDQIFCGYDGNGTWKVVGTEWLREEYGEWERCSRSAEGAVKFWYLTWPEGPSF